VRLFSYAYPDEWNYDAFYDANGVLKLNAMQGIFTHPPANRSWDTMPGALLHLSAMYKPSEEPAFVQDVGFLFAGMPARSDDIGFQRYWSVGAIQTQQLYIQAGSLNPAYWQTTIPGEPNDADANVHHWAWGFTVGYNAPPVLGTAINDTREFRQGQGSLRNRTVNRSDIELGGRAIQMGYALRTSATYADIAQLFATWLGIGQ
jgi:hypothetical protein